MAKAGVNCVSARNVILPPQPPPLGAAERIQLGKGSRSCEPRSATRGSVGLTEVYVEAVEKGSPILSTPLAMWALVRWLQPR